VRDGYDQRGRDNGQKNPLAPAVLVSVVKHSCLSLVSVLVTAGAFVMEGLRSAPHFSRASWWSSHHVRLGDDGGSTVRWVSPAKIRRHNLQERNQGKE
jgi:hypothetical protein